MMVSWQKRRRRVRKEAAPHILPFKGVLAVAPNVFLFTRREIALEKLMRRRTNERAGECGRGNQALESGGASGRAS